MHFYLSVSLTAYDCIAAYYLKLIQLYDWLHAYSKDGSLLYVLCLVSINNINSVYDHIVAVNAISVIEFS